MADRDAIQGIKEQLTLPLVVAPMFLVSSPELVLASCREGVIGSFPAPNARTLEVLESWMDQICTGLAETRDQEPERKIGPWAQNLVVHRTYARLADELKLVTRYQPPIVITALGSPRTVVDAVHDYGGLVIADVNSIEYARKAASIGVDGLALVSAGAGGHTGQMAGFAFVPAVREFFDGIIILAGAISTGGGIRAAEVLGADLAYMGTSFITAEESSAPPEYKSMAVEAQFGDLILTDSFTGADAYYMRQSLERVGIDPDNLQAGSGMDLSGHSGKVKAWKHVWSAGQGIGDVDGIQPLAGMVSRLKAEYEQAKAMP